MCLIELVCSELLSEAFWLGAASRLSLSLSGRESSEDTGSLLSDFSDTFSLSGGSESSSLPVSSISVFTCTSFVERC